MSRRLRGLERELGNALGSQRGGEHRGQLNLVGKTTSTMNFKDKLVGFPSAVDSKTNGVVHVGTKKEKGASPGRPRRLATLAAKQLRAHPHAGGAARAVAALGQSVEMHIGYCCCPYHLLN